MNTAVQQTMGSAESAVHPFHVGISEAEFPKLRRRLSATIAWEPSSLYSPWYDCRPFLRGYLVDRPRHRRFRWKSVSSSIRASLL